jgi:hypothetical protein
MGFRKPEQRKQGLKILGYGEDTSGKSLFTLSFPKLAIVDTESKLGVYENNPKYNQNIEGIADTVDYYEVIKLQNEVIANPKKYATFVTDSETNLYDDMQVSAMEVEEAKAEKYKKNIDDAVVAQRGWGKVKLNNARYRNNKSQMSALGVTIISIAHKKDITEDQNGKNVKIGEKPDLKEGSKHDYDIILRFYKTKVNGKLSFYAEVEKDTTQTYPIGKVLENASYNNWKEYIEGNQKLKSVDASYGGAINSNIENMQKEDQNENKDTITTTEVKAVIAKIDSLAKEKAAVDKTKTFDKIKEFAKDKNGNPTANYNAIKDIKVANELLEALNNLEVTN